MGLFHSDGSSSSCTAIPASDYQAANIVGSWNLHSIFKVVAGALGLFVILVSLFIANMHLFNYRKPAEQRQLIRIVIVPAIYVFFAFFAVLNYNAANFVAPIADLYECFAVVAIFYYMITIISPDENNRESFFQQLELNDQDANLPGGGLEWFSKKWFAVFQLLPGRIITTIVSLVIAGIWNNCLNNTTFRRLNTVINAINGAQMAFAILAIIKVYKRFKPEYKTHRVLAKLVCLKVLIGLLLIQRFVFSILSNRTSINGGKYISHFDLVTGIPNVLISVEMFIGVFGFIYSYTWRPFKVVSNSGTRGYFRGVVDVWNISDILGGILYALTLRSRVKQGDFNAPSYYQQSGPQYQRPNEPYAAANGQNMAHEPKPYPVGHRA